MMRWVWEFFKSAPGDLKFAIAVPVLAMLYLFAQVVRACL